MRRIYGLFIIIRAFAPLFLVAIFAIVTWQAIRDAKAWVEPQRSAIESSLEVITNTVDSAESTIATVEGKIDALGLDLAAIELPELPEPPPESEGEGNVLDFIGSLLGGDEAPTINPLAGLVALVGLDGLFSDLGGMLDIMRDLAGLSSVPSAVGEISNIIVSTTAIFAGLSLIFEKWWSWTSVLLIITLFFLIITYVEWLIPSLRRGWALLNDQPDPRGKDGP